MLKFYKQMKFLNKFQSGLKKTSNYISNNILDILSINKIDENIINDLETVLLSSDIGLAVTDHLINKIKMSKNTESKNPQVILEILATEIENILKPREENLFKSIDKKPTALLFVGVNGSGKTTTIGKLINNIGFNKKILIGACDTFRAAAVE